jgi:hypothetical protein
MVSQLEMSHMEHMDLATVWADQQLNGEHLPYVSIIRQSEVGRTIEPYIDLTLVKWCAEHCQHPWAWWFDAHHIYMGFGSQEELLLFQLSCQ